MLTFAASDPSGGAGLQADILTLASMGCHPLSVVTALTVQDTAGVEGVLAIDSDWVADQARALLEDMPVDAFKIGVLGSVENIAAIAEIVSDYPDMPLILDPVLASGRGDELASDEMTHAMRELLLPQTTILTPNSMEARRLADIEDDEEPTLTRARRGWSRPAANTCSSPARTRRRRRSSTRSTRKAASCAPTRGRGCRVRYHGSGCTLASAIAAMLANGLALPEAVREAQDYTWHALEKAYRPGMGQHLPDRLFWAREEGDARDATAPRRCRRCGGTAPRADVRGTHAASAARRRARRALGGLYAVTPDVGDTALLSRKVGAALDGGARGVQYRNKTADGGAAARAGARARARLRARAARCSSSTTTSRSPRRSAPTACTSARTTRDIATARAARRYRSDRSASRATTIFDARARPPSARAPTTSRSAASSLRATKPAARRADIALLRRARSLGVPVVAIGGITPHNARALIDAGADAVAVISRRVRHATIAAAITRAA